MSEQKEIKEEEKGKESDDNESKDSESEDKSEKSEKLEIEEVHEDFDDSVENDDEYMSLKEELDKANNLIDYFLILGLEPSIFMNDWLYENNLDTINKLYKEKLQPKILSSFPCFEKHTIAFDDSILSHCFPDGFEIISSQFKPSPKLFSFILDNNYFNLNYPQKYLTCFLFYENISGYRLLYEQNKKLSMQYNEPYMYNIPIEMSNVVKDIKNNDLYIPKCILIMSLYPYFGEFEYILTEIYNYSINLVSENEKEEEDKKDDKKKSKRVSVKRKKKKVFRENYLPIDKIVENLCIELPVPPRGISYLEYSLNNEKRIIKQNLMNQLPIVNINLKKIFFDYEVEDVISMYNYLFLETRVLFFSKNIDILNIYIYGLLSLLYPFQYQYQIVTILPEENFEIMESITPFIAGINQTFQDDFFTKRGYTLSDLVVVVDIDNSGLVLINEECEVPKFPSSNEKTLGKNLQSVVNKYLGNIIKQAKKRKKTKDEQDNINDYGSNNLKKVSSKELDYFSSSVDDETEQLFNNFNIDYDFNKEVNEIFFNFNANLLANYSKFLNLDFFTSNIMPCLEILFKVEDYLKEVPSQDQKFYEKFISETQIFGDFLYLRMIPKNSKEKIRILLFDEKINENSTGIFSKTPPMIFTNCQDYNFKEKTEIKSPRELNKEEIDYYNDIKNRKKLLEYGIIITNDENKKIKFKYPIFPKLTTKIFFENMLAYSPPKNWNEEMDNINADIISKSHLGGITLRQNDMNNYVYLCWMQMWAMTFWYCYPTEQNYRFQELLKILDRSHCYDMEIFNLLFEAISTFGKDKDFMILKLYNLILKNNLNPSFKVHSIVMKIIEKQKVEGNFNDKLQSIIGDDSNKKYAKHNFKKRGFRNKFNKFILSDNINFFAFDNCPKCQKDINIEYISKDYKNMGRDIKWAKCPNSNCKEYVLPRLTFQLGKEINKDGNMKVNTSNLDSVMLYSPYTLKNNYKTTILKHFNVKLDVEEYMRTYKEIFWDSLWYFKLNSLEYDFMFPYENRARETFAPNHNLYITIKGYVDEGTNNNNEDENISRFDNSQLKSSNFNFCIQPS